MPDDWDGHPLRKDYPSARVPDVPKATPPPMKMSNERVRGRERALRATRKSGAES